MHYLEQGFGTVPANKTSMKWLISILFISLISSPQLAGLQLDDAGFVFNSEHHRKQFTETRKFITHRHKDILNLHLRAFDNGQEFIHRILLRELPKKRRNLAKPMAKKIFDLSARYQVDPIFVLAIIKNESHYHPYAIGTVGEIGLMQIRPSTAKWITKKLGMKWHGRKSLFDPMVNIEIGMAYLHYLKKDLGHERLVYLAENNITIIQI